GGAGGSTWWSGGRGRTTRRPSRWTTAKVRFEWPPAMRSKRKGGLRSGTCSAIHAVTCGTSTPRTSSMSRDGKSPVRCLPMAAPHRVPPASRVLPSRVFYGWYIALACAALMLVGVGIGYYGLAVFLRPLREAHGWSNSVVSGATGLFFSVSGLAAALSGP